MAYRTTPDPVEIMDAIAPGPYLVVKDFYGLGGPCEGDVMLPENEIRKGEIYLVRESVVVSRQDGRWGGDQYMHGIVLYPFWEDGPIKFAPESYFMVGPSLLVPATEEDIVKKMSSRKDARMHPFW